MLRRFDVVLGWRASHRRAPAALLAQVATMEFAFGDNDCSLGDRGPPGAAQIRPFPLLSHLQTTFLHPAFRVMIESCLMMPPP